MKPWASFEVLRVHFIKGGPVILPSLECFPDDAVSCLWFAIEHILLISPLQLRPLGRQVRLLLGTICTEKCSTVQCSAVQCSAVQCQQDMLHTVHQGCINLEAVEAALPATLGSRSHFWLGQRPSHQPNTQFQPNISQIQPNTAKYSQIQPNTQFST
jgi:hypothetical protein